MALWRSWLARRPVTAEVVSSNLIQVAIKNYLSGEIDYNRRYGGEFFGLIKAIAMITSKISNPLDLKPYEGQVRISSRLLF